MISFKKWHTFSADVWQDLHMEDIFDSIPLDWINGMFSLIKGN